MIFADLLNTVPYKTPIKVIVLVANGIGQGDRLSVFRFSKCSLRKDDLYCMHISDLLVKSVYVGLLDRREVTSTQCLIVELLATI